MVVRLSALRAGHPLPPGRFLVLISVRGWVDPRARVRLEGLGQLKNPMTSSGIELATFRINNKTWELRALSSERNSSVSGEYNRNPGLLN
jgi:hypothetical protein